MLKSAAFATVKNTKRDKNGTAFAALTVDKRLMQWLIKLAIAKKQH